MSKLIDPFVAFFGLIVLSPLFIVIALLIKLQDGGPIFYRAVRIGLQGKLFELIKFRTMVVDAERIGAGITNAGDKRITPFGKRLRQFKLDEIPQLINIVKGELKFVGPRPEDPRYTSLYTEEQKKILYVYPGITSPASLYYKNEASQLTGKNWEEKYIKKIMPEKIAIDLKYFKSNTILSDCIIIFKTIISIFHFDVTT